MNQVWQTFTQTIPIPGSGILAQAAQAPTRPVETGLAQGLGFSLGPSILNLVAALAILVIGWIAAIIAASVTNKLLKRTNIDNRLAAWITGRPDTADAPPVEKWISIVVFWLIMILVLVAFLDQLKLTVVSQPLNNFLNQILGFLPKLGGAAILLGIAWVLATIVRLLVTRTLRTFRLDERLNQQVGETGDQNQLALSDTLANALYWFIFLLFLPSILSTLELQGTLQPVQTLLQQILNAIPQIFTAGVILVLAYVLGRFVSNLVTSILTGLGFNNVYSWLGLPSRNLLPPSSAPEATFSTTHSGTQGTGSTPYSRSTVIQTPSELTRTPSELVGIVVLVGIMLFATVAATNILQITALTVLVSGIVLVLGRILAGLVVFAIGLYLANLAFSLITSSGTRQSRILGQTARIAIIALVSAMALQQMGIASDIVNLAFGLLLGAVAVAIALAFGLGARDIAAGQVREWLSSFKEDKTPRF